MADVLKASATSATLKKKWFILNYAYPDRSITTDISKKDFEVQEVKEIRQIPLEIIMMNKEVDGRTELLRKPQFILADLHWSCRIQFKEESDSLCNGIF